MVEPYKNQRKNIQEGFESLGLIRPLIEDDLPLEIVEEKNIGQEKLQRIFLHNIPVAEDLVLPISYEVNLELEEPVIGKVEKTKTVERVILFFSLSSLFVLLIEMKESIQGIGNESGLNSIKEKFQHSISRINLILSSYIFPERHEKIEVKYYGIIAFNNDRVPNQLDEIQQTEIEKIFRERSGSLWITDIFGNQNKLHLHFIQNSSDVWQEFHIGLDDIFIDDSDFETAGYNTELSLPKV